MQMNIFKMIGKFYKSVIRIPVRIAVYRGKQRQDQQEQPEANSLSLSRNHSTSLLLFLVTISAETRNRMVAQAGRFEFDRILVPRASRLPYGNAGSREALETRMIRSYMSARI
jgi:hypothetical protein